MKACNSNFVLAIIKITMKESLALCRAGNFSMAYIPIGYKCDKFDLKSII